MIRAFFSQFQMLTILCFILIFYTDILFTDQIFSKLEDNHILLRFQTFLFAFKI